jgi:hypothetical protein
MVAIRLCWVSIYIGAFGGVASKLTCTCSTLRTARSHCASSGCRAARFPCCSPRYQHRHRWAAAYVRTVSTTCPLLGIKVKKLTSKPCRAESRTSALPAAGSESCPLQPSRCPSRRTRPCAHHRWRQSVVDSLVLGDWILW